MKTIWLTKVFCDDDEGKILMEMANSTKGKAVEALAKWCREQWKAQGMEKKLNSFDNAAAIDEYFAFWEPEEDYNMIEMEID
jgi:hypothetical protein